MEQSEKTLPDITSEEDIPLEENNKISDDNDKCLSKEINIKSQLDVKKFSLGSHALAWCMFFMFICVIISIWHPNSDLIDKAFDAYKLIVMTILGYIFGSNSKQ